jgi:hypothetical protein
MVGSGAATLMQAQIMISIGENIIFNPLTTALLLTLKKGEQIKEQLSDKFLNSTALTNQILKGTVSRDFRPSVFFINPWSH